MGHYGLILWTLFRRLLDFGFKSITFALYFCTVVLEVTQFYIEKEMRNKSEIRHKFLPESKLFWEEHNLKNLYAGLRLSESAINHVVAESLGG